MLERIKRKVRRRRRKILDRFLFYKMRFSAKRADSKKKKRKFFQNLKEYFPYLAYKYSAGLGEAGAKNKKAVHTLSENVKSLGSHMAMDRSSSKARAKTRRDAFWRAFKPLRRYTFFRFLSILLISTVFSSIITVLSLNQIWLISEKRLLLGVTIAAFLAYVVDILLMRRDYRKYSHVRPYNMINFVSHGAFAVVNLVLCLFFAHTHFYAYVFGITKLLRFTPAHMNPFFAAVIMNMFLMFTIPGANIQRKRRHKKRRSSKGR